MLFRGQHITSMFELYGIRPNTIFKNFMDIWHDYGTFDAKGPYNNFDATVKELKEKLEAQKEKLYKEDYDSIVKGEWERHTLFRINRDKIKEIMLQLSVVDTAYYCRDDPKRKDPLPKTPQDFVANVMELYNIDPKKITDPLLYDEAVRTIIKAIEAERPLNEMKELDKQLFDVENELRKEIYDMFKEKGKKKVVNLSQKLLDLELKDCDILLNRDEFILIAELAKKRLLVYYGGRRRKQGETKKQTKSKRKYRQTKKH